MKLLAKIEDLVVTGGLSAMLIALVLQVFMRYVVNRPLIWSEEFARYVFVWVTFFGVSYAIRKNLHISMEAVVNTFSKTVQKWVNVFTNTVAMLVFIYLIPIGIQFTVEQFGIPSTAMQIPMGIVFLSVPIGCALASLRLLLDTVSLVRKKGE